MNTSLLVMGNMLTGTACPGPASSKLAETRNGEHFSSLPAKNSPSTNAPEAVKTDNTTIDAQIKPADKLPQEFSHTLHKKMAAEVSRKAEAGTKSGKQGTSPSVATQPETVQTWLAQYSQNVEHGKQAVATKVEPKAGYELAQMLTDSRTGKFPSGVGKTTKPAENKPPAFNQMDIGLKTVFSGASKRTLAADTQPDEADNPDTIQTSNKTILVARGLTSQQTGKELMSEALVDADGKTATANGKPAIALASDASGAQKSTPLTGKEFMPEALVDADGKTTTTNGKPPIALASDASGAQKATTLTGKEFMPEALVDADGKTAAADEKPAMADKPAGSGGQKTPALNNSFQQPEGKYSDPHQKVTLGLEKPATVAEEPTDNKAVHSQTLSELSAPNDKMSRPAGNSLSGDSHLKQLNVTEFHASTGQSKYNGRSTFNNDSTPDFERQLTPGSTQSPITDFFSDVSAEAAKPPSNALSTDASASIAEQILESIHSSLREGDRQITIRLNPPELGKVFISFQQHRDQITGLLEVSKIQTRYEIEQALPQIVRTLQDAGIQIKRLEVILADQPEQQSFRDQLTQDGLLQHSGFAEGGNRHEKSADEWLANDNSFQDIPEPQLSIDDNYINVLM